ncbi:MAG: hypothetical protein D6812_03230 [Deltaproteobacteria bacterium]|nr:MAG: hypothetical protein D6812_03230 [Deltaproteobacteria bacterium]
MTSKFLPPLPESRGDPSLAFLRRMGSPGFHLETTKRSPRRCKTAWDAFPATPIEGSSAQAPGEAQQGRRAIHPA